MSLTRSSGVQRSARGAGSVARTVLRESSVSEFAKVVAHSPRLGFGTPLGDGRPVLLLPGFGVSDASLELMHRWLRTRGYRTHRSRMGINAGCSEKQCARLEKRLERIADSSGGRVAIIGHSRGGILAKALASARPDLVAGIITLGSPTYAAASGGRPDARLAARMVSSGHLPNLLSWHCLSGACPTRFQTALTGAFPTSVGFVSIYSRRDAIASWRGCRDPAAKNVEVDATHLGLAHNCAVYPQVTRALHTFWGPSTRPFLRRATTQALAWGRALAPR
jgi:triacylglycerol lipase